MLLPQLLLAFLSLTGALALKPQKKPADAVLLSDIQTLTLYANRQTSARRVSSIPQLKCIGGSARNLYDIDIMRCKNSGTEYDSTDVQWTCTAQLPPEFKLGGTDVICEGYESLDDPFVLKGSCGVEYRLVLTEEGERKYEHRNDRGETGGNEAVGQIIFWLVMAFFLFVIVRVVRDVWARRNGRGGPEQQPFFPPGAGDGGGDDDDNDPPPPYSPSDAKKSASGPPGQQQAWRPGFWTGAGAGAEVGAAAGYAYGNHRNNQTQRYNNNSPFDYSDNNAQPSSSRSASSSSSNHSTSFSSTRYESTGFGGSSRR